MLKESMPNKSSNILYLHVFFMKMALLRILIQKNFRKYRVNLRKARVILFIFKDIIKKKNYRSISENFKMMMDKIGEIWKLNIFSQSSFKILYTRICSHKFQRF